MIGYVLLAFIYSFNTPPFEAPDEYYHFAVIAYVARTGALPSDDQPQDQPWRQMVYHAPLYYLLSAGIAAPFDTSDFPSGYPLNPHAQIGVALASNNLNFVEHVNDWEGAALAVRAVRCFSIVLGAVTLISIYALARAVLPDKQEVALLAVLIVMLNPQFLYISGVVSNDNAVTAFATLSLAMLVSIMRRRPTARRVLALAVVMALAALSKASGMTIYALAFPVLLWLWFCRRISWQRVLLYSAAIVLAWALIAGWWYGRNLMLYGEFSAARMVAEATSLRSTIPDVIGELRGLYFSFWGLFGWFNISAPLAFYHWTLLLLGFIVVGVLYGIVRSKARAEDRAVFAVLSLYGVIFIAAWWQFNQMVQAAQGRLWFPLLGVLALGSAWGLSKLPSRTPVLVLLFGIGLGTVSFPFTLLVPAYTPSPQIPVTEWQPPAAAVAMRFQEPWSTDECLILWAVPPEWDHTPDSPINIRLYWQSLCRMTGYWSVFAHFVDTELDQCTPGDNRHVLAQVDTMPEGGRLPFPAFRPGGVVRDTISLYPPANIDLTREWHVQIGLYDAGGTFMRAFVSGTNDNNITVGKCAPESIVLRLP